VEHEWKTRKRRIDPQLDAAGWCLGASPFPGSGEYRTEEHPTAHGPADYALCIGGRIVAVRKSNCTRQTVQEKREAILT